MTDDMQRARELLAAEWEREGRPGVAMSVRYPEPGYEASAETRRALRAIEAALRLAVPEWRPIETAPRTGTSVLLWQPWKSGRNCKVIGHYANGWVDRDCEDMQPEPTHWMPLPAAPTLADEGDGRG